mmetsp:Transcript_60585/g.136366  ORF Transcript_60585/g.136366 Transcript_60585/m.136366 type:complete len:381 (-) Transcript_60585:96-1238(-)
MWRPLSLLACAASVHGAQPLDDAAALIHHFMVPKKVMGKPIEEIDNSPGNAVASPLEREMGLVTDNIGEDQVQESLRSLAHKYVKPTPPPTASGFPFYKSMETPMGTVGPQGSPWGTPMSGGWGLYEFNPAEVAASILNQNSEAAADAMDGAPELHRKSGQFPGEEGTPLYGGAEDPFSSEGYDDPYSDMPSDLQPYMEQENFSNPFEEIGAALNPSEIINGLLSPENIESVVHNPKAAGSKALYEVVRSKIKSTKLGNMLVNSVDLVQSCSDIDASIQCTVAEKLFNFTCRGWGGSSCLTKSAKCKDITAPGFCNDALRRLNMHCAGWGGTSCLSKQARCEDITSEFICRGANERFNFLNCSHWDSFESKCVSSGYRIR